MVKKYVIGLLLVLVPFWSSVFANTWNMSVEYTNLATYTLQNQYNTYTNQTFSTYNSVIPWQLPFVSNAWANWQVESNNLIYLSDSGYTWMSAVDVLFGFSVGHQWSYLVSAPQGQNGWRKDWTNVIYAGVTWYHTFRFVLSTGFLPRFSITASDIPFQYWEYNWYWVTRATNPSPTFNDIISFCIDSVCTSPSAIPSVWGGGWIPLTWDIWWNLSDPMQSLVAWLEEQWGLDISYCSSGVWSWIVNSPTKIYTRSPKATAVWEYCSYAQKIWSWQTELFPPTYESGFINTITWTVYTWLQAPKFFQCPYMIPSFLDFRLSKIPWLAYFVEWSTVDVNLAWPLACFYGAYLKGVNEMKATSFATVSKPWGTGVLLDYSGAYVSITSTQKHTLEIFLDMLLWSFAMYLIYKFIK